MPWFNPAELIRITTPPVATTAIFETLQLNHDEVCLKVAVVAKVATEANLNNTTLPRELDENSSKQAYRQRAITLMCSAPNIQRGIIVNSEIEPDNVVVFVASRAHQQTCELRIPKEIYDPFELLNLIDQLDATESAVYATAHQNCVQDK